MKSILIPTDFSECAYAATEVAVILAKKNNSKIYLLHVVEIPLTSYDTGMNSFENIPETSFMLDHAKDNMSKLIKEPIFNGIDVSTIVEFDLTYSRITNEAKNRNVDLIVMGSHGASGFQELIVGSNAERVVRFASCPVLTIKEKTKNFSLANIVFASDFKEDNIPFFNKLSTFFSMFDAHIHLLKVNTALNFETTRESRKLIENYLINHEIKNASIHIYNDDSKVDLQ